MYLLITACRALALAKAGAKTKPKPKRSAATSFVTIKLQKLNPAFIRRQIEMPSLMIFITIQSAFGNPAAIYKLLFINAEDADDRFFRRVGGEGDDQTAARDNKFIG